MNIHETIRKALYESIQAHAREWEPKFETGNGPVGDGDPYDKQVSEEKEECEHGVCCEKCGKAECVCENNTEEQVTEDQVAEEKATVPEEPKNGQPETTDWNLAPEGGESEVGDGDPFGLAKLMEYTDEENEMLQEQNNRFQDIMGRISKLYD